MKKLAAIFTGLVAIEHIYILILEMFLWTTEYGLKTFHMTIEKAEISKVLAANQGLYNGFLAAGLIWSFFLSKDVSHPVRMFFLICVVVAGIFGGATARPSIFFIQGIPALIALVLVYISNKD